jgi:hypothetical protein
MNTLIKILIAAAFVCGSLLGIFLNSCFRSPAHNVQQLTLEQILSIKELHLVRHVYQDLFFLHKNNDLNKPIRAIAQIPVIVTAYINLKDIEVIHQNDSVKMVILPHAQLSEPNYQIERMIIRETRSLQVHIGKDMYPRVGQYLSHSIADRRKAMRKVAEDNHILLQAEAEVKTYVETLLKAVGRTDVLVKFKED